MAPKKKGVEESSGLSKLERAMALMEDVNKKMKGRAILQQACDYILPFLTKRLPTGLINLDLALRGGFPSGGISQIAGRRNAGKTLIAWHVIRQLQYLLGDKMMVLLAMTELQADRSQARLAGVRIGIGKKEAQLLNAARKEKGEAPLTAKELTDLYPQVGVIHELHAESAEDFYDVILRAVDENMYHLIVIDSIGNILSNAENENESVHDKVYGGASAPNTTFIKKLTNLLTMPGENGEVRDTCVIGINQIRDNIKDPNGPPRSPGGNALEHAKLVDLFLESGSQIGDYQKVYTPDGVKSQWVVTGKEVNWKIVKGKAGIHDGARGKFVFQHSTDNIDFFLDAIVAGVTHNVIELSGAWYGLKNDEGTDYLLRTHGKDAFIAALYEDSMKKAQAGEADSFMSIIMWRCYKKAGIEIDYAWAKE